MSDILADREPGQFLVFWQISIAIRLLVLHKCTRVSMCAEIQA